MAAEGPPSTPVLKPFDAWWTVLVIDWFAIRLVRLVKNVAWVTPTRLTVLAHLLGLVSAVTFAGGALVVSAVLFEVRFILDCADGKLARERGTSSAAGAFLDYVGDYLVASANVVGVALHLYWHADLELGFTVGLPAAFLAHIAAGQARTKEEAEVHGTRGRRTADSLPGGYRQWMAERRLRPLPSRIDAEHGLLFIVPIAAVLFDELAILAWGARVGTAYFFYEVLHLTHGGYELAVRRDRAA